MTDKYGFVEGFPKKDVTELIAIFNSDVGNSGWATARMHFLEALKNEFLSREIVCSSFISENTMSLKSKIRLVGNCGLQEKSDDAK